MTGTISDCVLLRVVASAESGPSPVGDVVRYRGSAAAWYMQTKRRAVAHTCLHAARPGRPLRAPFFCPAPPDLACLLLLVPGTRP
eukprot:4063673-Prymnesium_polylepis.1